MAEEPSIPKSSTATFELVSMQAGQVAEVCSLIGLAMNADEARWASATMSRHFRLSQLEIPDGRHYFLGYEADELLGIVGLHHYEWGPPENVWLGWFAVLPKHQGRGIGSALMRAVESAARRIGYRKLFIETYSSSDFERARRFYSRHGFSQSGRIAEYLTDGSDMVVFSKLID